MDQILIDRARGALKDAYAPYSSFRVGAAVLTKTGKIYTGCNIENSSYSLTCCAERVAIFKAVSTGEKEFAKIAVVADGKKPVSPCGACRQVMAEFFDNKVIIILTNLQGTTMTTTINQLLPNSFHLDIET